MSTVDLFSQNPYWLSQRSWCLLRWLRILLHNRLSITWDFRGSKEIGLYRVSQKKKLNTYIALNLRYVLSIYANFRNMYGKPVSIAFQNCNNHIYRLRNDWDMVNMAKPPIFHFGHGWTVCCYTSVKLWNLPSLKKALIRIKKADFEWKSLWIRNLNFL